jgi:formiminoglutamate deiminase
LTSIHTALALLPDGWHRDVRIIFQGQSISSIEPDTPPRPDDEQHQVLVPAMCNLHSHAFQRAMAGLAERRGPASDNFWSWRETMYHFALNMSPEQVEAVAARLYMEMLEAGFGRVGEFHYLHHDRDGRHYANIAEMAERLCAAAAGTGIAMTLLPTFYARSGFGGAAPLPDQRRFVNSLDSFGRLLEASRRIVGALPGGLVGLAPHSLRAIVPDDLAQLVSMTSGPIHIHAAEQVREVEQCVASLGARPVEWLLDNAAVDDGWCIIHATHMTPEETRRLAESGAVAGLCPITEANLGDGTFPARNFLDAGGRLGVGSDSNIDISLPGELRMLEYSQRLATRSRNVMAGTGAGTGQALFDLALAGGAQALGVKPGLRSDAAASMVSLDISAAPYLDPEEIMDVWIFSSDVRVDCVWVHGQKQVEGGRHRLRPMIDTRFRSAMQALREA